MTARADLFAKLIQRRFANHKSKKVEANKQSHFTLGWFSSNESRVAAIAVLVDKIPMNGLTSGLRQRCWRMAPK